MPLIKELTGLDLSNYQPVEVEPVSEQTPIAANPPLRFRVSLPDNGVPKISPRN